MDAGQYRELALRAGYKNILLSYYASFYPKNVLTQAHNNLSNFTIFLDSGGYTARVKGIDINMAQYCAFAKQHGNMFHAMANLDVHDLPTQFNNQAMLEATGHYQKALPVYHLTEFINPDPKVKGLLEEYCKKHEYVALGGTAGVITNRDYFKKYLNFCFQVGMKYKTKFHGFGMTATYLLERYPFYSVDSTSWQAGARYGQKLTFKGGKLSMVGKRSKPSPLHFIKHTHIALDGIKEFAKMEKYYTELWKIRGINWTTN